uniref:Uncharacterized protein n=1 Tax=Anguilla anguilla TaxID=7936 RepID=A0A0E9ULF7_ANGAN
MLQNNRRHMLATGRRGTSGTVTRCPISQSSR